MYADLRGVRAGTCRACLSGVAETSEYAAFEISYAPPAPDGVWRDLAQPLYVAARRGQTQVVARLLERGADVAESAPRGGTALHWAAHNGHLDVARLLITAGAELDAPDARGHATPLVWALLSGHLEVMELLLRLGADPDARDKAGETPLVLAIYDGNRAAAELLLRQGADPQRPCSRGRMPLQIALERRDLEMASLLRAHGGGDAPAKASARA